MLVRCHVEIMIQEGRQGVVSNRVHETFAPCAVLCFSRQSQLKQLAWTLGHGAQTFPAKNGSIYKTRTVPFTEAQV